VAKQLSDQQQALAIAAESARRSMESLRLYRPLPAQYDFHTSLATERIVRGGNRSGKSTCAAVEFARAATGQPIFGPDGKAVRHPYPTDRPLTLWVIGYDQEHIGQTIYRLLFRRGVFKIIRDLASGQWRQFRPWDKSDMERENETRPSRALIEPRFIDPKGWAWETKAGRIFTSCRLLNGTEIYAFSSKAEPKQGDPVDLIWIDEDLAFPRHVAEFQARLSDRKGRLIWSAFPHSKNFALLSMSERAREQADRDKPDVEEVRLRFSDNPHIDPDEKRKRREGWSDEEIAARDEGEFQTDTVLVYPSFSPQLHGTPSFEESADDNVDRALRERRGQPPDDWTRYIVLDPGHTVCALLCVAVPPESVGDALVCYKEFYYKRIDAYEVAKRTAFAVSGQFFEAFLIDFRAGRQTPMGFGKTIRQQFSEAFAEHGLECRQTGSNFIFGSDNVPAGLVAVRDLLSLRRNGRPKLRIVLGACPNLVREFQLYRKKSTQNEVADEPASGQRDHLMDCLRYAAVYDPKFVHMQPAERMEPSAAYRQFQEWQAERAAEDQHDDESINLGPVTTV